MSQFSLQLPDSLHEHAKRLATETDISLNQFIVMADAEKVSAYKTEAFLRAGNFITTRSITPVN